MGKKEERNRERVSRAETKHCSNHLTSSAPPLMRQAHRKTSARATRAELRPEAHARSPQRLLPSFIRRSKKNQPHQTCGVSAACSSCVADEVEHSRAPGAARPPQPQHSPKNGTLHFAKATERRKGKKALLPQGSLLGPLLFRLYRIYSLRTANYPQKVL